jgi:hypothetical protein
MSSQPVKRLNSDFAKSEGTFTLLEKSSGSKEPIHMKNSILTNLAQKRALLNPSGPSAFLSQVRAPISNSNFVALSQSNRVNSPGPLAPVQASSSDPAHHGRAQTASRPLAVPGSIPSGSDILARLTRHRATLRQMYEPPPPPDVPVEAPLRFLPNGLVDIVPRLPSQSKSANPATTCAAPTLTLSISQLPERKSYTPRKSQSRPKKRTATQPLEVEYGGVHNRSKHAVDVVTISSTSIVQSIENDQIAKSQTDTLPSQSDPSAQLSDCETGSPSWPVITDVVRYSARTTSTTSISTPNPPEDPDLLSCHHEYTQVNRAEHQEIISPRPRGSSAQAPQSPSLRKDAPLLRTVAQELDVGVIATTRSTMDTQSQSLRCSEPFYKTTTSPLSSLATTQLFNIQTTSNSNNTQRSSASHTKHTQTKTSQIIHHQNQNLNNHNHNKPQDHMASQEYPVSGLFNQTMHHQIQNPCYHNNPQHSMVSQQPPIIDLTISGDDHMASQQHSVIDLTRDDAMASAQPSPMSYMLVLDPVRTERLHQQCWQPIHGTAEFYGASLYLWCWIEREQETDKFEPSSRIFCPEIVDSFTQQPNTMKTWQDFLDWIMEYRRQNPKKKSRARKRKPANDDDEINQAKPSNKRTKLTPASVRQPRQNTPHATQTQQRNTLIRNQIIGGLVQPQFQSVVQNAVHPAVPAAAPGPLYLRNTAVGPQELMHYNANNLPAPQHSQYNVINQPVLQDLQHNANCQPATQYLPQIVNLQSAPELTYHNLNYQPTPRPSPYDVNYQSTPQHPHDNISLQSTPQLTQGNLNYQFAPASAIIAQESTYLSRQPATSTAIEQQPESSTAEYDVSEINWDAILASSTIQAAALQSNQPDSGLLTPPTSESSPVASVDKNGWSEEDNARIEKEVAEVFEEARKEQAEKEQCEKLEKEREAIRREHDLKVKTHIKEYEAKKLEAVVAEQARREAKEAARIKAQEEERTKTKAQEEAKEAARIKAQEEGIARMAAKKAAEPKLCGMCLEKAEGLEGLQKEIAELEKRKKALKNPLLKGRFDKEIAPVQEQIKELLEESGLKVQEDGRIERFWVCGHYMDRTNDDLESLFEDDSDDMDQTDDQDQTDNMDESQDMQDKDQINNTDQINNKDQINNEDEAEPFPLFEDQTNNNNNSMGQADESEESEEE